MEIPCVSPLYAHDSPHEIPLRTTNTLRYSNVASGEIHSKWGFPSWKITELNRVFSIATFDYRMVSQSLIGGLEQFLFSHILGTIIPID